MTPKDQFKVGLNKEQAQAFDELVKFVDDPPKDIFLLKGYAGTGKTFLVKRLINYLMATKPACRIAITAPTNKAVKVLSKVSCISDYRVTYQTIHKLLGLTEEITPDGEQVFVSKFNGSNDIDKYKYLVVDEVSMLNDELFLELHKYSLRTKMIFMGDPAQIPPVNKLDCIPFNENKKIAFDFRESVLTTIMRQNEGNPIIQASFNIRKNLTKMHPIPDQKTQLTADGHGVIRIDSNKKEDRDKSMNLFREYFDCEDFRLNADHAKVIAWRNKTIDTINGIIRSIIFKDERTKIMVGEKLIANKPVMEGQIILFNTSDEFEVKEFDIGTETVKIGENTLRLNYYDCDVEYIDIEGVEVNKAIRILHESSENDFKRTLNLLKEEAKKLKGANRSWLRYYEFMRKFADVNYNYAITAHKSQGSTYKNVFIVEDDIDINSNIVERNRIKYTSYTRPTDKLFILKR